MKTFSTEPVNERTDPVPCPLCGSWESRPVWNGDSPFVSCVNCGFVYQKYQPENTELLDRYDRAYFEYELENEERFFSLIRLGLCDIGFFRLEEEMNGAKPAFLDIGCATGRLLEFMKGRGFPVTGVEVCRASAEYGNEKRGVTILPTTLEGATFPDGSFGVVHASHLIEHLRDPAGFVREVNRVLVPGGRFICATPNIGGFQARLTGSAWRSAILDHMGLFSKGTLGSLLEREGFSILKLKTWGGIAQGLAPARIKRILDRGAKIFGYGDVMILLAVKR